MKPDKFSDILGSINSKFIVRAMKKRKNKQMAIKIISLCACLVLVFSLCAHYGLFNNKDAIDDIIINDPPGFAPTIDTTKCLAKATYPERIEYPADGYFRDYEEWYQEQNEIRSISTDASGNSEYVKKLLKSALKGQNENNVLSPANIYFALCMLAQTTDGSSRDQILDVVGKQNADTLCENANKLWQKMYKNDGNTTCVLANSLWLSNDYDYVSDTVNKLKDKLFSSVYSGDFADKQYSKALENWINEQTSNLLKDSVSGFQFPPENVFSLASTIYFKSGWLSEFSVNFTEEKTFHGQKNDTQVEFLNGFQWGYVYSGENFKAVTRALSDGNVIFILPDSDSSVSQVLMQDDTYSLISGKYDSLSKTEYRINLSVPKFDVSAKLDLCKVLKNLGVTDVLNPETSDFTPINTQTDIFLSQAEHAARFKIDEKGVEGAAYTVMNNTGSSAPEQLPELIDFVVDRPFIFAVTGLDGIPLFVGTINNL